MLDPVVDQTVEVPAGHEAEGDDAGITAADEEAAFSHTRKPAQSGDRRPLKLGHGSMLTSPLCARTGGNRETREKMCAIDAFIPFFGPFTPRFGPFVGNRDRALRRPRTMDLD